MYASSMSDTTMTDQKQIVQESEHEAWNEGNVDAYDEVYSTEYVLHSPLGDQELADVKETIEAVRAGNADFEFAIMDVVGEGNKVVLRYTMAGTNTGPSLLTEEPTGKSWEASGISIYRFEDGTIIEQWDNFDYLSVLQQLGQIPSDPTESSQ